jgi:hypothetical protein
MTCHCLCFLMQCAIRMQVTRRCRYLRLHLSFIWNQINYKILISILFFQHPLEEDSNLKQINRQTTELF